MNPSSELNLGPESGWVNVDEAAHRPASEIHWPGVWLRKGSLPFVCGHAYDKLIPHNPAAHVTVDYNGKPAEHPLVFDYGSRLRYFFRQNVEKPAGRMFIIWSVSGSEICTPRFLT